MDALGFKAILMGFRLFLDSGPVGWLSQKFGIISQSKISAKISHILLWNLAFCHNGHVAPAQFTIHQLFMII